jgi:hypothetical protein
MAIWTEDNIDDIDKIINKEENTDTLNLDVENPDVAFSEEEPTETQGEKVADLIDVFADETVDPDVVSEEEIIEEPPTPRTEPSPFVDIFGGEESEPEEQEVSSTPSLSESNIRGNQKLYDGIAFAETGPESNPWIRTKYSKPTSGGLYSSAWGPKQLTYSLARGYKNGKKDLFNAEQLGYLDDFLKQGKKMLAVSKSNPKDPIYGFGGKGDLTSDKDKKLYNQVTEIMLDDHLKNNNGDVVSTIQQWRGETQENDPDYFKKVLGVIGSETLTSTPTGQQTSSQPQATQPQTPFQQHLVDEGISRSKIVSDEELATGVDVILPTARDREQAKTGFVNAFKKSIVRGSIDAGPKMLYNLGRMVTDERSDINITLSNMVEDLDETRSIYDIDENLQGKLDEDGWTALIKNPALLAQMGLEQLPNIALAIGGGSMAKGFAMLTKMGAHANKLAVGTGAVLAGLGEGTSSYDEAIKQGFSQDQARNIGGWTGLATAGMSVFLMDEMLGGQHLSRAVNSKFGSKLKGKTLQRMIAGGTGAFLEGTEEGVTPFVTHGLSKLNDKNRIYKKTLGEVANEGAQGFILGGVMGGVMGSFKGNNHNNAEIPTPPSQNETTVEVGTKELALIPTLGLTMEESNDIVNSVVSSGFNELFTETNEVGENKTDYTYADAVSRYTDILSKLYTKNGIDPNTDLGDVDLSSLSEQEQAFVKFGSENGFGKNFDASMQQSANKIRNQQAEERSENTLDISGLDSDVKLVDETGSYENQSKALSRNTENNLQQARVMETMQKADKYATDNNFDKNEVITTALSMQSEYENLVALKNDNELNGTPFDVEQVDGAISSLSKKIKKMGIDPESNIDPENHITDEFKMQVATSYGIETDLTDDIMVRKNVLDKINNQIVVANNILSDAIGSGDEKSIKQIKRSIRFLENSKTPIFTNGRSDNFHYPLNSSEQFLENEIKSINEDLAVLNPSSDVKAIEVSNRRITEAEALITRNNTRKQLPTPQTPDKTGDTGTETSTTPNQPVSPLPVFGDNLTKIRVEALNKNIQEMESLPQTKEVIEVKNDFIKEKEDLEVVEASKGDNEVAKALKAKLDAKKPETKEDTEEPVKPVEKTSNPVLNEDNDTNGTLSDIKTDVKPVLDEKTDGVVVKKETSKKTEEPKVVSDKKTKKTAFTLSQENYVKKLLDVDSDGVTVEMYDAVKLKGFLETKIGNLTTKIDSYKSENDNKEYLTDIRTQLEDYIDGLPESGDVPLNKSFTSRNLKATGGKRGKSGLEVGTIIKDVQSSERNMGDGKKVPFLFVSSEINSILENSDAVNSKAYKNLEKTKNEIESVGEDVKNFTKDFKSLNKEEITSTVTYISEKINNITGFSEYTVSQKDGIIYLAPKGFEDTKIKIKASEDILTDAVKMDQSIGEDGKSTIGENITYGEQEDSIPYTDMEAISNDINKAIESDGEYFKEGVDQKDKDNFDVISDNVVIKTLKENSSDKINSEDEINDYLIHTDDAKAVFENTEFINPSDFFNRPLGDINESAKIAEKYNIPYIEKRVPLFDVKGTPNEMIGDVSNKAKEEILNNFGNAIDIEFTNLSDGEYGNVGFNSETGKYFVRVNRNISDADAMTTIAHELGHAFLPTLEAENSKLAGELRALYQRDVDNDTKLIRNIKDRYGHETPDRQYSEWVSRVVEKGPLFNKDGSLNRKFMEENKDSLPVRVYKKIKAMIHRIVSGFKDPNLKNEQYRRDLTDRVFSSMFKNGFTPKDMDTQFKMEDTKGKPINSAENMEPYRGDMKGTTKGSLRSEFDTLVTKDKLAPQKLNGVLTGEVSQKNVVQRMAQKFFEIQSNAETALKRMGFEAKSKIHDIFIKSFNEGRAREDTEFKRGNEFLLNEMERLGIDPTKMTRSFRKFDPLKKGSNMVETKILDEEGNETSMVLSGMERVALILHSMNADNKRHILNGGFKITKGGPISKMSEQTLTDLKNNLTEDEKNMVDVVDNWFNSESLKEFAKVYEKLNKEPFNAVQQYFPIRIATDNAQDVTNYKSNADTDLSLDSMESNFRKPSNPSMTKERSKGSKRTIYLDGAMDAMLGHLGQTSKYIGFREPTYNADIALKDLNGQMVDHGFETSWNGLRRMTDMISGEYKASKGEQLMKKATGKIAVGALGFRVFSALKQFGSALPASTEFTYASIPQIIADLTATTIRNLKPNSKLTQEMKDHNPTLWRRSLGRIDEAVNESVANTQNQLGQWSMSMIKHVDTATIASIWNSSKKQVEFDGTSPTDAKYWDKVNEKVLEVVRNTQPEFNIENRAFVAMDTIFKPYTMFFSARSKTAQILMKSIMDLRSGKNTKHAIKVLTMGIMGQSLLMSALDSLRAKVKGKEEEEKEVDDMIKEHARFLTGLFAGLSVVGDGAFSKYGTSTDPIHGTLGDIGTMVKMITTIPENGVKDVITSKQFVNKGLRTLGLATGTGIGGAQEMLETVGKQMGYEG